jgi:hypothetical protein
MQVMAKAPSILAIAPREATKLRLTAHNSRDLLMS